MCQKSTPNLFMGKWPKCFFLNLQIHNPQFISYLWFMSPFDPRASLSLTEFQAMEHSITLRTLVLPWNINRTVGLGKIVRIFWIFSLRWTCRKTRMGTWKNEIWGMKQTDKFSFFSQGVMRFLCILCTVLWVNFKRILGLYILGLYFCFSTLFIRNYKYKFPLRKVFMVAKHTGISFKDHLKSLLSLKWFYRLLLQKNLVINTSSLWTVSSISKHISGCYHHSTLTALCNSPLK